MATKPLDGNKPWFINNKVKAPKKINRLDKLKDVVEGPSPSDGDILAYDSAKDKYIVKSVTQTAPKKLDGGTF